MKKIENIDQVSSTFEKKFELKKVIGILLGREVILTFQFKKK